MIGQYIRTVGSDIVFQQVQLDHLALSKSDIDWLLQQGSKDMSTLLQDDGIPQEDLAPALFLPSLQATPAPTASIALPTATPGSTLTSLTPLPTHVSPSVSALVTPLARTFEQLKEHHTTPKAAPMDISPPANAGLPLVGFISSASAPVQAMPVPVIQQLSADQQMTDAQRARVDKVLKEYQNQELLALQELQNTRRCNREAELFLELEWAKLKDAELYADKIKKQITEHLQSATPTTPTATKDGGYVPPSQRPGLEAAIAASLSSGFDPSRLSSVSSSLLPLPARPNAPNLCMPLRLGQLLVLIKGKAVRLLLILILSHSQMVAKVSRTCD